MFYACPARLLAVVLVLSIFPSCSPSGNGGPKSEESPPPTAVKDPLQAYAALMREVMEGNLIALYDCASSQYRATAFPAEKFRPIVAGSPMIKSLGVTGEQVGKMNQRELVDAYFKLLPLDAKARLASAMSGTKILGKTDLADGRVAVRIESGGAKSKIIWKKEAGEWRMDGEEREEMPKGE